ncbi:hypothetical protein B0H14DRAFT_2636392 [Mycena olivaceomarginata]|nr:hypothetical protein B0H14DRAFT_2636392 [Mycena olivaceomarginata]
MSQFIQRKFALSSRQSRSRSYGRMAQNIGHGTYVHVPPSPAPSRFTTFGIPACTSHPAANTGFGGTSSRSMRCGDRKLKKLLPRKDYVVRMPAAAKTLDFDIALVTRLNALAEFGFDTTIAWCKALLMQVPTSRMSSSEVFGCERTPNVHSLVSMVLLSRAVHSYHESAVASIPGYALHALREYARTRFAAILPHPHFVLDMDQSASADASESDGGDSTSASAVLGSFPLFSSGGGGGDLQGLGAARVKGD